MEANSQYYYSADTNVFLKLPAFIIPNSHYKLLFLVYFQHLPYQKMFQINVEGLNETYILYYMHIFI